MTAGQFASTRYRPLLSPPLRESEIQHLEQLGTRLRTARAIAGVSRSGLARATGLNPKTIYRIESGTRRTRARTIRILAAVLSDDPDALTKELIETAGPALAAESRFIDRVESRRLRRVRRTEAIDARAEYAAERADLELEWAMRAERHAAFRANMQLIDLSFRMLRRLGAL